LEILTVKLQIFKGEAGRQAEKIAERQQGGNSPLEKGGGAIGAGVVM
jgi:hypothetical protein